MARSILISKLEVPVGYQNWRYQWYKALKDEYQQVEIIRRTLYSEEPMGIETQRQEPTEFVHSLISVIYRMCAVLFREKRKTDFYLRTNNMSKC